MQVSLGSPLHARGIWMDGGRNSSADGRHNFTITSAHSFVVCVAGDGQRSVNAGW